MHCNLRLPYASSVIFRCNYDAHTKAEIGQRQFLLFRLVTFLLLIPYVKLRP